MVEKINGERFNEVIKDGVSIVDFSATWCGPCQMLAPVMEKISEEYQDKVKFYNIDIDDDQETAEKNEIQAVPTIIIFKDGEKKATTVGLLPKSQLIEWIDSNI